MFFGPFIEFRGVHGDQLGLLVPLQLEEAYLFFDYLAEQKGEQLFVISCQREIARAAAFS